MKKVSNKISNIPKTWRLITIGDISITSSGGTPDRKNSNYFKGDIPWVKSGELNYNTIIETEEYITQEALDYSSAKIFAKGSLLIALYGNTVGRMAFLGVNASTNQAVASITPFCINPKYVYYFLMHSKEELLNKREGSAQPNISQKVLNDFPFPLAPVQEQNRIVEKIEELFSEIDKSNIELNIAKTKGKLLLRTILNKAFSKIESEYDLYSLEELCENITDGSHFSPQTTISGYPYITVRDIKNDRINFENCKKISEESFLKLKQSGCSPKIDDVLFSKDGTVGKVVLNDSKNDFVVLSSLAILTAKVDTILPKYLFYYLKSDLFLNQAISSKRGVAIKRIVLRDLKSLMVNTPRSLDDQLKIVNLIEESISNTNILLRDVSLNIEANKSLYLKVLQEAFQGKLSSQLDTDISVESLIKEITKEKEKYLQEQQEIIKNRPKIKRMEKEKLSIIQVLEKNKKPISSKQLWEDSMYSNDIEKFYAELKKVQDRIIQEKSKKETLISLK